MIVNSTFFFKLGFSLWHNSWKYYVYRALCILTLALFWLFILWDFYENPKFENILENVNTSLVHLAGLLKFFLMVSCAGRLTFHFYTILSVLVFSTKTVNHFLT
jgi:hypothetical protein